MLNRTVTVDSVNVHPTQEDLNAAVTEFKRQVTEEGKTLDGEPEATLLSHFVGQSMTFSIKAKTTTAEAPKAAESKPGGAKQSGNS